MKSKIYGIIFCLAFLIIPFFIMHTDDHVESSQSLCPFKMLTGFPCPGCGITKSIIFFYEGDLWKSLSYHIFGPFVVIYCAFSIFYLSYEIFRKKDYHLKIIYSKYFGIVLATILICFHLIRTVIFVHDHTFHEILKESIWM